MQICVYPSPRHTLGQSERFFFSPQTAAGKKKVLRLVCAYSIKQVLVDTLNWQNWSGGGEALYADYQERLSPKIDKKVKTFSDRIKQ